jgi:diacylglycerol kinase family enzyme
VRTEAHEVEINLEEPRLVSWDGESGDELGSFRVEIVPKALRVLSPPRTSKEAP